jgi:hypothetical protein
MLRRSMLLATPMLLAGGWAVAQTPLPAPNSAPSKAEAAVDPELARFRSAYTSGDGTVPGRLQGRHAVEP